MHRMIYPFNAHPGLVTMRLIAFAMMIGLLALMLF